MFSPFFILHDKEESLAPAIIVAESRKRRWEGLNQVLEISKHAKPRGDYSYVVWEQVRKYFPITRAPIGNVPSQELPEPKLAALATYLSYASICFPAITEGREDTRLHFIAPVLIIVCAHFNGDVEILAEEDIDGNRIRAHGHFEFVLKRGSQRICIVEAKKEQILQGKTQSLLGCEALCDVEGLPVTYGISTNFLEWCFLKNEADKITEQLLTSARQKSIHGKNPSIIAKKKYHRNSVEARYHI
jgi:hypothetical protein